MSTLLSDEHEDLRRTVHRFLDDKSPEPEVRRLMATESGYDPVVWEQMAAQLGLQALIIPESYGGAGFGYFELTLVLEEMGRVLLCAPYFSTVALAVNMLLAIGDEEANARYLPGIATGATIAFDAVAGEMSATLAAAMPHGGKVVVYGGLAGAAPGLSIPDVIFHGKRLEGFWLPLEVKRAGPLRTLLRLREAQRWGEAVLGTRILARLPFERIGEALALQPQGSDGKVLLTP